MNRFKNTVDLTKNRYKVVTIEAPMEYGDEVITTKIYKVEDTVFDKPGEVFHDFTEAFERSLDLNESEWTYRNQQYNYKRKLEYWTMRLTVYLEEGDMERFALAIKKLRYFGEKQLNLDLSRAVCFECLEDRLDCPSGRCTE